MWFWSFVTLISRCNPGLLSLFVEILFTSAPGSNMAISIKLLVLKPISILPVRLQSSLKFPRYTIKITTWYLSIWIPVNMISSIRFYILLIFRTNPRLFSLLIEICLIFCPESKMSPSIHLFSSSTISVIPEGFMALFDPIRLILFTTKPGRFLYKT